MTVQQWDVAFSSSVLRSQLLKIPCLVLPEAVPPCAGAHRALPHLSGGTTASLIHVCLVPSCVTLLWTFFNFLSKLR